MRTTSDYGWSTNRNSNDIHPASPGCQPGTYPLNDKAEEELKASKHRSHVMIIALSVPAIIVVVICEPRVSRLAKLNGYGMDKW